MGLLQGQFRQGDFILMGIFDEFKRLAHPYEDEEDDVYDDFDVSPRPVERRERPALVWLSFVAEVTLLRPKLHSFFHTVAVHVYGPALHRHGVVRRL